VTRRQSRLTTLVRVAELQEAAARGHAARALVASRAAQQAYVTQLQVLRARRVEGGTREALTASAGAGLAEAAATRHAEQADVEAAAQQRAAVGAWTAARLRHRLLSELAERQREEAAAEVERREQQLADELAASRAARR
jgi:flagellar biosynthesis chaperone FliJ